MINNIIKEFNLQKQLRILRSRESFWEYCKTKNPFFFRDEIVYLKDLANLLEDLYRDRLGYKKIMINIPPRHGKTYIISFFNQWVLGDSISNRILTTSYNDILSTRFATSVRDAIQEVNQNPLKITYSDIFPKTVIKRGDGAKHLWSLEGSYMNFLASSFNGTLTGFGGNIGIIDDPIKTAKEASNIRLLDEHYDWYANTFLSRLEEGCIQIIIMTRWADDDLCGKILQKEDDWFVYKLEVYSEDNKELNRHRKDYETLSEENKKMLNPETMSYKSYTDKAKHMSEEILRANYHQTPINIKGKLYQYFKTYDIIPKDNTGRPLFEGIYNYTDVADTGNDYLCSIDYGLYQGYIYILNVYYTQEPQEITEDETAKMIFKDNVNMSYMESNSGGRAFARNVAKIYYENFHRRIAIETFHQSQNKEARIISNSSNVMNTVLFPKDWKARWPEFFRDMNKFQRVFKANSHDDAPDAVTGIVEKTATNMPVISSKIKIGR